MKIYKIVISVMLLLTYSLGFVHNIIPHTHNSETGEHIIADHDSGHKHHQHTTTENSNKDHEHTPHNDHFDENLYDYFVCLFNEKDHPAESCNVHHHLPAKSNAPSLKKLDKTKLISTLLALFSKTEQTELIAGYHINSVITYLAPSIADNPLRGPPTLS